MKILYYTAQIKDNELPACSKADYMSDLLFHGLRQLYGADCVDYPKKQYMYTNYGDTSGLWGRGFTYSKTLDDIVVDREDLARKVNNNHFDIIIFSIHHSLQMQPQLVEPLLADIRSLTHKTIMVVDGHDWPQYHPGFFRYTNLFFKREIDSDSQLKPIWFAIPEEKIIKDLNNHLRIKDFADIVPGSTDAHWPQDSRKTHNYTTEQAYYNDYATSKYAFTCKKGGWDCMRHCEILANGCIPIFTDIEQCPKNTLAMLPKQLLTQAKYSKWLNISHDSESWCFGGHQIRPGSSINENFNEFEYEEIQNNLYDYTKQYLTTKFLAKYVLEQK